LSNLDANLRDEMRSEIRRLHDAFRITTVYVTHDQAEAMVTSDRIVVMNHGVVQQNDAPLKLYHEPDNLFVAGFLGSPPMNLISGTLKAEGDRIRFREIEGGTIEAAFPAADRPAAQEFIGKSVILGIRPEDLEVATFSRKEGRAAGVGFPAIVDLVEPMGAETNLYLQTGAHTLVCRSQSSFDHREAGRRMQFQIDLSRLHFFDPDSTNRLR